MSLENLSGKPKQSEEVRAIRIDLEPERKRREVNVRLNSSGEQKDFLGKGIEGRVTRVTASLGDKETGSLAFKQYKNQLSAAEAKMVWSHLKALGVPVPHTFRLIQSGTGSEENFEGTLMTELTDDWNTIFLSTRPGNDWMLKMVYDTNPEVVRNFAQEDFEASSLSEEFASKCNDIAEKLSDAGVLLRGGDVLGVVYKQDGSLEPVLFDMGNVSLDGTGFRGDEPLSEDEIRSKNAEVTNLLSLFVIDVQKRARELIARNEK